MPIEGSAGTLDIENATLRSNAIAVLTNLVTGNDRVRESGAPALEVYGDPSNGGNEARLELVSNTAAVSSSAFTRLTSNAGVFSIETGTGASDNGTITFGGFANERLRITGDGKVGVGTTDPQYKLDVGNGGGDVMLRVMHQNASSGKLIFGRTGSTEIRSHAIESYNSSGSQNNYMKFLVHDGTEISPYETRTEVMTLLGNGNVGIGTTNPVDKFHLYGSPIIQHSSIDFTGSDNSWHIVGTWDATGPEVTQKGGTLHLTFLGGQLFGSNPAGKSEILAKVGNGSAHRSIFWKVEGEKIFTDVRMRRVSTNDYKYDICVKMRHYTNHTMRTECSRTTSFERKFTSTTEPSSTDTTNVELGIILPSTDTNGSLGIGTTNPGAPLEVHGADLTGQPAGTTGIISRHVAGLDGVLNIFGVAASNGEETVGLQTQIDGRAWVTDINAGWNYGNDSRYDLCLQPYKGNVGIGTTNPSTKLHVYGSGTRTGGDDAYGSYCQVGSNGSIWRNYTENGGRGAGIHITDVAILPGDRNGGIDTAGETKLGSGSQRWGQIYSTNSTISTSDRNKKQDINDITESERKVATKITDLFKTFRFKDDVSKKGDDARLHNGVIAQDLIEAFESEGLDAHRYGLFCYDEKWTVDGEHELMETTYEKDGISEYTNEDGEVVKYTSNDEGVKTVKIGLGVFADKNTPGAVFHSGFYSIRYEELLCFVVAGELQNERLKYTELEARILALENA